MRFLLEPTCTECQFQAPAGYDVRVLPAWTDFPTDDLQTDAAAMNSRLQTYIDGMPEQYYWVHKRFKVRPAGEAPVY